MPDAGQIVRALDFPASVTARQVSSDTVDWDAYQATDPSCEMTFIAGTSGRGKIDLFIRFAADGSGEFIETGAQVRETDENGTIFREADETNDGIDHRPATNLNQNVDGFVPLSGLTPGQTYWAQMQHRVDTGTAVDVLEQVLVWVPLT